MRLCSARIAFGVYRIFRIFKIIEYFANFFRASHNLEFLT